MTRRFVSKDDRPRMPDFADPNSVRRALWDADAEEVGDLQAAALIGIWTELREMNKKRCCVLSGAAGVKSLEMGADICKIHDLESA